MWTRKQYIQGVLLSIPLLALEFYRVPTPLSWVENNYSWVDCANSVRGCFERDHFWGIIGFTLLFAPVLMPALESYIRSYHRRKMRSPKSRERTKD